MFYTYILRSLSQPEQRYIGSTADLKASLAIRRFFLLAKISGVQRSGRRMPGNLSSIALANFFLQFIAVHPSVALRAMEGILRTLRFTPLIFAIKKNLRIANLAACHP